MKPIQTILVVDDEANIRKTLQGTLEDEGYAVVTAESAEEGFARLAEAAVDLLLLDVQLPGKDGIAFLEELASQGRAPAAIVMSGHATIKMAVQATKSGAHDFLEKPVDPPRLLLTIRRVLEMRALRAENRALRDAGISVPELIGDSTAMDKLRREIAKASPSHGRVLITGENGTGKELVARAVHRGSERAERPFVKVNCAAIPKDLIESELFGHEKGSFTGATQQRIGKIEQANGGTLLLDEVGDMALETQAKLLRVLEARELERVGGRRTISFDVRVVSATNKDLSREIAGGAFREDLYYRLAVIPIRVPPLRERLDDLSALVMHFSELFSSESGRPAKPFAEDAIEVLRGHGWPGNVRGFKNAVERAQIMSEGATIGAGDLAGSFARTAARPGSAGDESPLPNDGSLRDRVEQYEIGVISEALRESGGNVAEAARLLETDRANLHRKMKRYGIVPKEIS